PTFHGRRRRTYSPVGRRAPGARRRLGVRRACDGAVGPTGLDVFAGRGPSTTTSKRCGAFAPSVELALAPLALVARTGSAIGDSRLAPVSSRATATSVLATIGRSATSIS